MTQERKAELNKLCKAFEAARRKMLIEKAAKGQFLVYATSDGTPYLVAAADELERDRVKNKEQD